MSVSSADTCLRSSEARARLTRKDDALYRDERLECSFEPRSCLTRYGTIGNRRYVSRHAVNVMMRVPLDYHSAHISEESSPSECISAPYFLGWDRARRLATIARKAWHDSS